MSDELNLELDQLLEQRIQENFGDKDNQGFELSDERLKEMNKKLPSWSLEPPFSFLK